MKFAQKRSFDAVKGDTEFVRTGMGGRGAVVVPDDFCGLLASVLLRSVDWPCSSVTTLSVADAEVVVGSDDCWFEVEPCIAEASRIVGL